MVKIRKYAVSWPCERCHAEARGSVIMCANSSCKATHTFIVRCICDQRVRFSYSDHTHTATGADATITRMPDNTLPDEIH